jgi:putative transposase
MHCLRKAPDNLKDYFRKVALRKIGKDRTLTLNGCIYEGQVALIGKRVELLYHDNEPELVEVKYKDKSYAMIRPVNPAVNYRVKRDKNNNVQLDETGPVGYRGGKLWSVNRRNHNEE